MTRYLVVITQTIEYTREFTAKNEESAIEKAKRLLPKSPYEFDQTEIKYEYSVEEP